MPTLTIKNIPQELYQALKKQAMLNHRSLNKETIISLAKILNKPHLSEQNIISNARSVRVKESFVNLTDDLIKQIKEEDRL